MRGGKDKPKAAAKPGEAKPEPKETQTPKPSSSSSGGGSSGKSGGGTDGGRSSSGPSRNPKPPPSNQKKHGGSDDSAEAAMMKFLQDPANRPVIALAIIGTGLAASMLVDTRVQKEINWQQFRTHFLETGLCQELTVTNKSVVHVR